MSALEALAPDLLAWLWRTTWQVAVLAALVFVAVRLAGRRLAPPARYALWLLVVARLLVPALPEAPWSIFNLAPPALAAAPVEPRGAVSPSFSAAPVERREGPPRSEPEEESRPRAAKPLTVADLAIGVPAASRGSARGSEVPESGRRNGGPRILLLWMSVAGALILRILVVEVRFGRRLRGAAAVADPDVLDILAASARSLGVAPLPRVLETDAVGAPTLCGVRRPRLLLPPGLVRRLSAEELACVFRHELAHLKARDGLLNALLALLECVHWFNPAVWLAARRIRAERESARDWAALRAPEPGLRRPYGRTLIKLLECCSTAGRRSALLPILEGNREMKRRISMIANYDDRSGRGRAPAFSLAALLVLVAFTGARPLASPPGGGPGSGARQKGIAAIHVERRGSVPAWEEELRRRLETKVSLHFAGGAFKTFLNEVREVGGVNLVVHPDTLGEHAEETVELDAPDAPVRRALDLFCETMGIEWGLAQGAVYVAPHGHVPSRYEQRVYDVRPLLSAEDEGRPDRLIGLLRDLVSPVSWEVDAATATHWKGLLLVNQTDAVHREIERFLTRLLNRGRSETEESPAESAALRKALDGEVSVHWDDQPLKEVCAWLHSAGGLSVRLHRDVDADAPITLHLEQVPAARVVEWIATLCGLQVAVREETLVLGEGPSMEIRYLDVRDLLQTASKEESEQEQNEEEAASALGDLVRGSVAPATWDSFPNARIGHWDGLMLVNQSPAVQSEIEGFLGALRRALGK